MTIIAVVVGCISARLGWGRAVTTSFFLTAIIIAASLGLMGRDVNYPEDPFLPEYQANLDYLLAAGTVAPSDLSSEKGGFFKTHLPIVSERDFPLLARKLKSLFRKAAASRRMFYIIVLGGMKVGDIDEPLLKAAKGLRNSGRADAGLVIVAPATISSETKAILEKKGLKVRLTGSPKRKR